MVDRILQRILLIGVMIIIALGIASMTINSLSERDRNEKILQSYIELGKEQMELKNKFKKVQEENERLKEEIEKLLAEEDAEEVTE